MEEQTEEIHLFGTADCLDNIRLEQTQSFLCPAIGPLPAPQARFLIQVQLKEDYTLLRFYKDSVSLTCLTKEGQKMPNYKMDMAANQISFQADSLTGSLASGFSSVNWKGKGIVYQHSTGLMLALSFTLNSGSF